MFKNIRILILLIVLLVVAVGVYQDKNQDWQKPIYVAVYPVNVDGSAEVANYISTLNDKDFQEIESYLKSQSQKYGQNASFYYRLGDEVKVLAPEIPKNAGMSQAIIWSLKFRYYAYKHAGDIGVPSSLRLFLNYHNPKTNKELNHTSTALENGRIGVVHLFADSDKTANNNVVIAHESLHAFGATDKYNLTTGQPLEPIGLGDIVQNPRYPQKYAELMAMHKALSPTKHTMARQLSETVVGELTAMEMGWLAVP
ncbi:MAG: hypothetical protein Q4G13_03825 [Moraxella sp.]|nr:hypothetical protein [Moraxella sp.]